MTTISKGALAIALTAALTACGSSEQPANNVVAENDMNSIMADPSNPFAASEMKMHDAMAAAVGTNAADTWVKKMIEHHRGAVEMSQIVLDREIEALQKLVASGNPNPASAQLYAPAESRMHDAMMAAKGVDLSDTFIRKMLEHHKGAVALSDIALANVATGAIRSQIEKTKAEQQKEIEHIEGMLSGQQPSSEPTAPTAPEPVAKEKEPAAKPATPKPEPAKPKTAAAKPAEPKAADPNCLPEHRAAGHC
jgi:uncharacterized protein (DUF305 family)